MNIIRVFGAIVSASVLVLIVKWTVSLYERDIDDLPLLVALQEETRIRPNNVGGKKINYKGLSVNNVLDHGENDKSLKAITLAPGKQTLLSSEVTPILSPVNQLDEVKDNVSHSITVALEKLLGLTKPDEKIGQKNIEIHIASYSDVNQANAHWFLLQQSNSDLLVNYNHQVVKVKNDTKEIYRLRIVGFDSVAKAQDMCDRLVERGEKCVPAIGDL